MDYLAFALMMSLTLNLIQVNSGHHEDEGEEEEAVYDLEIGFRFQNLGESCSPSDPDNWEIYEEYLNLSQRVKVEQEVNNNQTGVIELKAFLKTYGRGRFCHPKFICLPGGYCECRPGFTLEIDHFLGICQVDTNYPCSPLWRYYSCATNRSCLSSGMANNRRPEVMPGRIGEVIRYSQEQDSRITQTKQEYICVCNNGSICQRSTAGQILEEIKQAISNSSAIYLFFGLGGYGSVFIFLFVLAYANS